MSDLLSWERLALDEKVRCSHFFTFIGGLLKPCIILLGRIVIRQIVLRRQIVLLRYRMRERGEREDR